MPNATTEKEPGTRHLHVGEEGVLPPRPSHIYKV